MYNSFVYFLCILSLYTSFLYFLCIPPLYNSFVYYLCILPFIVCSYVIVDAGDRAATACTLRDRYAWLWLKQRTVRGYRVWSGKCKYHEV